MWATATPNVPNHVWQLSRDGGGSTADPELYGAVENTPKLLDIIRCKSANANNVNIGEWLPNLHAYLRNIGACLKKLVPGKSMSLTSEQVKQYRSDGFAIGGDLLTSGELAQLRQEIDGLIQALPAGQRPENIPSVHYANQYLCDLFLDDRLVNIAEKILGPDIALFTTYVISKKPREGLEVAWHQDAACFPIEPMETFTLCLAVDDSVVSNGCMRVLPGSHRIRRILPHRVDTKSGSALPLSLEGVDLNQAHDVELGAGSYSVHDPFIFHGSNPNRSDNRRCGITIKYIPTHVAIDRRYVSPTGFDWQDLRLYLARGQGGNHQYWN